MLHCIHSGSVSVFCLAQTSHRELLNRKAEGWSLIGIVLWSYRSIQSRVDHPLKYLIALEMAKSPIIFLTPRQWKTAYKKLDKDFADVDVDVEKKKPRRRRRVLKLGYTRRNRWKLKLRVSRLRISWLLPLQLLKRIRKAYIQAMLSCASKENKCGFVMAGHWSFPVVVPFRSAVY